MKWKSEKRQISDLKPAEYNPRQMTNAQAQQLEKSIDDFGLAEPIVINTDNTIIGGHQRYYILLQKGVKEVDVYLPEKELSKEKEKELNLRLNKNLGEWDLEKLANNFEMDDLINVGFKLKDFEIDDEIIPDDSDDIPEMVLHDFEKYDYLVFVFKDDRDLMYVMQKYKVDKVRHIVNENTKKIGLGRVLDGKLLLDEKVDE